MDNLKILLCCGAGMSSGFLASNARKFAKKRKINATIEARSYSEVREYLSSIDILMLGPHYANELDDFKRAAEPYHVAVTVIPTNIYSQLDGQKLIEYAEEVLSNQ